MEKKTFVINLLGGPGAGKSTFATMLFSKLKKMGISCEYVDEFAKALVWEGRNFALNDQLFVLANQNNNLLRVKGKVNVIITDSPVILSIYYNHVLPNDKRYNESYFNNLVLDCYGKFDNLTYYLERNFPYVKEGRYQTEEESIKVNEDLKKLLKENNIKYKKIACNEDYADEISNFVASLLNVYDSKKEASIEYERRFLLKNTNVLKYNLPKIHISQTYIDIGQTEKRIRSVDDMAFYYTEKVGKGEVRSEYEKQISREEYDYFMKNYKKGRTIEKDRYKFLLHGTKTCEINIFDQPKDLKLVEVEFDDKKSMKNFTPPSFFGKEVTNDLSYNSHELAMKNL